MSLQKRIRVEKSYDHERVFLDHYDWLLDWAYQLTHNNKDEAEDLVQDLYVTFVQSGSKLDLSDEDRLRGYLYRTIKRLFILRRRRHGRGAISSLLIVDFDSVENALAGVDRSRLLMVRSDLARICEYAQIRRRTHRGASALILRFFFGYLPSEIAKILQTNRATVDKLTSNARAEARLFLSKPGALRFMDEEPPTKRPKSRSLPEDPYAMYLELRRRVFADASGDCMTQEQVGHIYGAEEATRISTDAIAHLVSCALCLERVNHMLGLPTLDQRFPSDDRDKHKGDEPPTGGSGGDRGRKLRRKLQEVYEHRPKSLQIAVNGEVRGVQGVTATRNQLRINLEAVAQIDFVEVLSEQGVSLLFHALEETDPLNPSDQGAEVSLSDGRTLAVAVSLDEGIPTVELTYFDALYDDAAEEAPEVKKSRFDSKRTAQFAPALRWWERLAARFKGFNWGFLRSLSLATAVALVLATLVIRTSVDSGHSPTKSAQEVLAYAVAQQNSSIPVGGAVRQVFSLEVRSDHGALIEKGKVDVLRGRTPSRQAIKLLSPTGTLVRGQWSDSKGKASSYPVERDQKAGQAAFDAAWKHAPDASDFAQMVSPAGGLTVHQEESQYVVSYTRAAGSEGDGISSAHLVLTSAEMRPVSESFEVEAGGRRQQYRFEQLSYQVLSPAEVTESDFEIDPSLAGSSTGAVRSPLGELSLAHLTLEAYQLLNNLGPEIEGNVDVQRTSDDNIEISGVVPTALQKESLLHVLGPLRKSPHVSISLHSNDEPLSGSRPSHSVSVEALAPVSESDDHAPLDSDVRTALRARGYSNDDLDVHVRQFSSESIARASRIHREGWTIRQLGAADFSTEDLQSLSPEERMLWLTLIDKHLVALAAELEPLATSFASVQAATGPVLRESPGVIPQPENTRQLAALTERLSSGAERLDRLLTTELAVSPGGSPTNHNVAEIVGLLTDLRIEESMLHQTVLRLQAADSDRTK